MLNSSTRFLSCSPAKEFGLATEEFCRLIKEFYSVAKESGRVAKEFCPAVEEFCRLKLLSQSARLLCG
ncbi:hypothetical protein [Candidatus Electronema sp. PJ]|uniref:hypothetical protein n=1 Tax=Candidatus Electronema sp. PJ TaxID=3401572 RepID=UPI003AA87524